MSTSRLAYEVFGSTSPKRVRPNGTMFVAGQAIDKAAIIRSGSAVSYHAQTEVVIGDAEGGDKSVDRFANRDTRIP
jgi:hypothetical protein